MVQIRQAIYIITPLPHPITASSPAYVLGERPRRAATLATPPQWWGCRIWPLLPSGRCVEDRSGGWRPAPSPCLPPHPTSSSSMSRRCGSLPRPRQAPPHMGGGGIWRDLPYPMDGVWRPDPAHGGRHRHLGGPAPHLLPHKAWRLSSTAATTSSSTTSCVLLHDATLLVRCSSGLPDVAPPSQGRLVGRRHGRPAGLHIVFLEKMFAVRLLGSTRRSLRICSSAVGSIIFCRELSLAHRKDFSPCV
jgi:hypothetical protein